MMIMIIIIMPALIVMQNFFDTVTRPKKTYRHKFLACHILRKIHFGPMPMFQFEAFISSFQ